MVSIGLQRTATGKPERMVCSGKVNRVMSIYRVTVKALFNGPEDQFNVHHYEFPGYVPDETQLQEFVDNIAAVYEEQILQYHTALVSYEAIEVRRVDVGDLPSVDLIPDGWPVAGAATAPTQAPQVAALVVWKAATAFPRSTRSYLPVFFSAAVGPQGQVASAIRTVLAGFATIMEEIDITGDPPAQKVAVQYGGDPRVVVASNLVTAAPIPTAWGIQRRRRVGSGS